MAKTCTIENCEDPIKAKGYSSKHHQRWSRYGDPLYCKTGSESGEVQTVTQKPKPKLDLSKWY